MMCPGWTMSSSRSSSTLSMMTGTSAHEPMEPVMSVPKLDSCRMRNRPSLPWYAVAIGLDLLRDLDDHGDGHLGTHQVVLHVVRDALHLRELNRARAAAGDVRGPAVRRDLEAAARVGIAERLHHGVEFGLHLQPLVTRHAVFDRAAVQHVPDELDPKRHVSEPHVAQ